MATSGSDRMILRELAQKVAEIGHDPIQAERAELWRKHNDLEPVRPLVLVFPEGAWGEMLPWSSLQTADPWAQCLEWELRHRIYCWEHLQDDNVIEPVVFAWSAVRDSGWGIEEKRTYPREAGGAVHYEPVIRDEADIEKIRMPVVSIDREETSRGVARLEEAVGDLLRVEVRTEAYNGFAILDEFARWRGLEQVLWDLADRPQWVHQAMERMYAGMVARHEAVMASGLATLNNRNHYAGSGGNGYTRQLPQPGFDGVHVRSRDLWGFATTQMFSEVSPDMHEEFALRYERRFLERFGLNCYGCCEPLHRKLHLVKTIPNLRRVSISPWADVRLSAEQLGGQFILSWKPNPAWVAGEGWAPDRIRAETREMLTIARQNGCVVEMVMKDTHTCRQQPHRMWEWVRIAREVAGEFAP